MAAVFSRLWLRGHTDTVQVPHATGGCDGMLCFSTTKAYAR